jgi:hypothetical protein
MPDVNMPPQSGNTPSANMFGRGLSGVALPQHKKSLGATLATGAQVAPALGASALVATTSKLMLPMMTPATRSLLRSVVPPPRFLMALGLLTSALGVGALAIGAAAAVSLPKRK